MQKKGTAQNMHKWHSMIEEKLHLAGKIMWEINWKRCRLVCKSQNVCPCMKKRKEKNRSSVR